MIGQTLGHYRIDAALGAGGMGEVYRALDTRLGRDVALKLLPPGFASDPQRRERFRHEARTLATLDHPNIVTVYSVEEAGGLHFLTMALVEGATLDRSIPPDGLPLGRLLDLAIPLADALAAAHEKGVVHRDLKPGNVMVTPEGRLTVLDFGIAKTAGGTAGADEETLARTRAGTLVGTMPYMSPEQVEGMSVDERSDVFSLGVVLYEMATGRRPFQGSSAASLASAILKDPPAPLSTARPDLPGEFGRLVSRCLEKSRERRVQKARDVKSALESMRTLETSVLTPTSAERSVAVLPFVNHSSNADDEYFSDGITEEIMSALGQVEGLRVAARTSSFAFKGGGADLRMVGETLRVRTVLEGSVRRSGNRLRITAQLVDVGTGYHLWSERYDRELTDVFEIQDEIAATIVEKLEGTLGGTSGKRTIRRGTSNIEAFDLYLRGLALLTRRGRSIHQAIACFDRAIELDPALADAHALLADSNRLLATYGFEPASSAMPRARAAAEKALELDGTLAEAHATLADVAGQYDRDSAAAFASWSRALELQPGHTRARCERAAWGLAMGRLGADEAIAEARQAVEADPLNVWAISMLSLTLGMSERAGEGLTVARRGLEIDPDSFLAHYVTLQSQVWDGDWTGAVATASPALRMSGRHPWTLAALGVAHAGAGHREKAEAVYAELEARALVEYVQPFWLAYVAAALGKVDEAMRWVQRGVAERDPMIFFLSLWPGLTSVLREHAAFSDVLETLGFESGE